MHKPAIFQSPRQTTKHNKNKVRVKATSLLPMELSILNIELYVCLKKEEWLNLIKTLKTRITPRPKKFCLRTLKNIIITKEIINKLKKIAPLTPEAEPLSTVLLIYHTEIGDRHRGQQGLLVHRPVP